MEPKALLMALAVLVAASGCKSTGSSVSPAHTFVAPDWDQLDIKTVAFLGLAGLTAEETKRAALEKLVAQELASGQDRFLIIQYEAARARATKNQASDLFARVVKVRKDSHKVDPVLARDLCAKIGVDGLLFSTLDDWQEERIDPTAEGTSFTKVGLTLSIYSGKTGLLAWEGSKDAQADSEYYRPALAGSGVYTDPAGAQRTDRAEAATPDPPAAEQVVPGVMAALMGSFPPRAGVAKP